MPLFLTANPLRRKCLLSVWVLAVAISVGLPGRSLAAGSNSVGVSMAPAQAAITAVAGTSTTVKFTVTNIADHDETFQAVTADYTLNGTTLSFVELGSEPHSAATFIELTPNRFELTPNQTAVVILRVSPGSHQQSGKYRTAVVVGPASDAIAPSANLQALVGVTGSVAGLVGITVTAGPSVPAQLLSAVANHLTNWWGIYLLLLAAFAIASMNQHHKHH